MVVVVVGAGGGITMTSVLLVLYKGALGFLQHFLFSVTQSWGTAAAHVLKLRS